MKKRNLILAGIFIVSALLNIAAWSSRGFSDWFRRTVFCGIQYVQGHISSVFPFSVGEILLAAGALLLLFAILSGAVLLAGKIVPALAGRRFPFLRKYLYGVLWVTAVVALVMSTNCFVLYHCSSFGENYVNPPEREYTVEELAILREYVVLQCNELATQMERDEDGFIVYDGNMSSQAREEMQRLGEEYPLLEGYYTEPKKLAASKFFSQQYILGYYFPFSMEANYNREMYIANMPVTLCHELSHIKGFIYEDDANFIAYLACTSSDDAFFRYSGYLSVVDYLDRDLYESLGSSPEAYRTYVQCTPLVQSDNIFLTKQAWEEVEASAVIDTEVVKQASRGFLETNLKLNGVEEGIASYGEVVKRMLEYYDGILY